MELPSGCGPKDWAYSGAVLRVIASRSAKVAREYYTQSLKREDYYSEGQEIRGAGKEWAWRSWGFQDR
jgi:hypothetical protein